MKFSRIAALLILLGSISFALAPAGQSAFQPDFDDRQPGDSSARANYHGTNTPIPVTGKSRPDQTGIREEIPAKYAARFSEWKKEFLTTETGRKQWEAYQNNPNFTLTLAVSRDNAEGATTGNYKWNEAGELIGATITLGLRLDVGYPNPIYFPVMNSLGDAGSYKGAGSTLAATKLAHEFGHVNRTSKIDGHLYQLQTRLIPQYNKIFLSNGRKADDPRLLELARQMGGTPVQIWEDREYWGEANAMIYLRDRFAEHDLRCSLFNRIRHSIGLYAKSYESRFQEVAQSTASKNTCGWQ